MSPSLKRAIPWFSGLVLVAGVLALAFSLIGNTADTSPPPASTEPVVVPKKEKQVPLPRAARLVAAKWIQSAVLRQHVEESWRYTHPSMRAGYTLAQWKSGEIPVVPFPNEWFQLAPMRVDYAFADRALLEVSMLSKDDKKVKSQIFFIGLRKAGKGTSARWLVDYWAPRGAPKIPLPTN
jgi:hypothetical protein